MLKHTQLRWSIPLVLVITLSIEMLKNPCRYAAGRV